MKIYAVSRKEEVNLITISIEVITFTLHLQYIKSGERETFSLVLLRFIFMRSLIFRSIASISRQINSSSHVQDFRIFSTSSDENHKSCKYFKFLSSQVSIILFGDTKNMRNDLENH